MSISRRQVLFGAAATMGAAGAPSGKAELLPGICSTEPKVEGFSSYCFVDGKGAPHPLYVTGKGPPVLFLHELPGLNDHDLASARRVAGLGYTVAAPLLFGTPGGPGRFLHYWREICGEFRCSAGKQTSPVLDWLLQLCPAIRTQWPEGKGIGVVGMCLTGAFPLVLLKEPSVTAAVLCQPTIPFRALSWIFPNADLGLHPDDLKRAIERKDVPLLGIHYHGDRLSPNKRFNRLVDEFPQRFYRLDLKGSSHSSIAKHACDDAIEEIRTLFNQYLKDPSDKDVHSFPRNAKLGAKGDKAVCNDCVCPTHHG